MEQARVIRSNLISLEKHSVKSALRLTLLPSLKMLLPSLRNRRIILNCITCQ